MNNLTNEIKKIMIDEKLNQKNVAEMLEMTPNGFNNLLARGIIKIPDLIRIADVLGYDVEVEFIRRDKKSTDD